MARGYPKNILLQQVARVQFAGGAALRQQQVDAIAKRRAEARFPFGTKWSQPQQEATIAMTLRYDPRRLRLAK